MSRLDEPLVTWGECVVGWDNPEGVVVALPHDADRLDIGLAIRGTEWGAQCMPSPYPGEVTIRAAWARLLTPRVQWEWEQEERHGETPTDDPPEGWWPDEGTPSWIEDPHGDEVWIATWTT